MSIATKRGDGGQTSLVGGLRVERYGAIDAEIRQRVEALQRELYKVGSAIATPPQSNGPAPEIAAEMADALDAEVHRIKAEPGVRADWSLPGELPGSSARVERMATALAEAGAIESPHILADLNRLPDLLWLFGRLVEARQGVAPGPRRSRAW